MMVCISRRFNTQRMQHIFLWWGHRKTSSENYGGDELFYMDSLFFLQNSHGNLTNMNINAMQNSTKYYIFARKCQILTKIPFSGSWRSRNSSKFNKKQKTGQRAFFGDRRNHVGRICCPPAWYFHKNLRENSDRPTFLHPTPRPKPLRPRCRKYVANEWCIWYWASPYIC